MVARKQVHASVRRITAREYLEQERAAEIKSEFHDGVLIAMAGASPEHNAINSNMHGELYVQLRGTGCRLFISDLRVHVPLCEKYCYPDLIAVCGEPAYQELTGMRSLLNPTLIVEILSDSTEQTDRGEKWACYQTLGSLQTYVLVAQNQPIIEVYRRQGNGWFYTATVGLESTVSLEVIGCTLPLADVYANVPLQPFPAQPIPETESATEEPSSL